MHHDVRKEKLICFKMTDRADIGCADEEAYMIIGIVEDD